MYRNYWHSACLFGWIIFLSGSCIQKYAPTISTSKYNYLVVDGFISSGPDSTYFTLSRTVPLSDSSQTPLAELHALITIEGSGSDNYTLNEIGNGLYGSLALPLNNNEQYRVRIQTNNGEQFLSDFVPVRQSPPIDSLSWSENDNLGVQIYVNSHDPTDSTKYYHWTYQETWEHQSYVTSFVQYINGQIINRDMDPHDGQQVSRCWSTAPSTDIFVASTAQKNGDVIYEQPLELIPEGSIKLSYEYSTLVKQFAITSDAYQFYQLLKVNSEQLGDFLTPEPSTVTGNIQCITNPGEKVLGYVSAGTEQEKRILINRYDLHSWSYNYFMVCHYIGAGPGQYAYYFDTLQYVPIQISLGIASGTFQNCGNCLTQGGVNIIPPYWPN